MLRIFSSVEQHKPEVSIGTTAKTSTPLTKLDGSVPTLLPSGGQLSPIGETNKGAPRSAGMTVAWLLNKNSKLIFLAVTKKKIVDTIFDSPKGCKQLLQFPSPNKDSHAPVKKPRKRKLLKEDVLKAVVSIYST